MSLFKHLKKTNKYATVDEPTIGELTNFIDTGVYSLNALLSGSIYKGFPSNKIVVFCGDSGVGKTFYMLLILKNFLEQHKDGKVIIWDSEGDIRQAEMVKRGLDTSRIAVVPVRSVQEFGTSVKQALDYYMEKEEKSYPLFLALDSLGHLASAKETQDMTDGANTVDMTRAKAIKAVFRILTLQMAEANVPMFVTNHVYSSMSAYAAKGMGGGSGPTYASSQIITLTKRKEKDANKNIIGGVISATTTKSRFTKEGKKIETLLFNTSGLDRFYGLHLIALKTGIFKKISVKIELPDGTLIKANELAKNPEKYYTKEVLDLIDEACQKEFLYGNADDSILYEELDTVEDDLESDEE